MHSWILICTREMAPDVVWWRHAIFSDNRNMFIFFAILCDSGGRATASKQARLQQDCWKARKSVARQPQDHITLYCKAVTRMLRNVRLQLKIEKWPNGCTEGTVWRLALSSGSLPTFARPSCGSLEYECEIIVWTSDGCFTFFVILCKCVWVALKVSEVSRLWQNRTNKWPYDLCETSLSYVARGKNQRTNGRAINVKQA